MSTIALHTVNCDTDGDEKSNACRWWVGQERTAAEARREARAAGWSVAPSGKGPDYCPPCTRSRQENP